MRELTIADDEQPIATRPSGREPARVFGFQKVAYIVNLPNGFEDRRLAGSEVWLNRVLW